MIETNVTKISERRKLPRFTSKLQTRKERDGTYTLTADLVYYSALVKRTIRVPRGFNTDMASVPRLPFAYLLAGDTAHEAAVIHDYLYRSDDSSKDSRKLADDIFLEAMKEMKEPKWRREAMWFFVRLFGNNHYKVVVPVDEPAKSPVIGE